MAKYGVRVRSGEAVSLVHHQFCCLKDYSDHGHCLLCPYFSRLLAATYSKTDSFMYDKCYNHCHLLREGKECWSQLKWVYGSYWKYNFSTARETDLLQAKQSQIQNMCFDWVCCTWYNKTITLHGFDHFCCPLRQWLYYLIAFLSNFSLGKESKMLVLSRMKSRGKRSIHHHLFPSRSKTEYWSNWGFYQADSYLQAWAYTSRCPEEPANLP